MPRRSAPSPRPLSAKILVFLAVLNTVVLGLSLVTNVPIPLGHFVATLLVQVLLVVFSCVSEQALPDVIRAVGQAFRGLDPNRKQ